MAVACAVDDEVAVGADVCVAMVRLRGVDAVVDSPFGAGVVTGGGVHGSDGEVSGDVADDAVAVEGDFDEVAVGADVCVALVALRGEDAVDDGPVGLSVSVPL